MIDPNLYAAFCLAALLLVVVPGPAVLYIVGQSVHLGRTAGVVSALGVATGGLVHVLAAAVGLSALLVASSEAFTAVKLAGAAYLVYLGVTTLLGRGSNDDVQGEDPASRGLGRSYRRGVVVNVLNPKTALFFLAFLPQFVDPDGPARAQLVVLGLTFVAIAVVSDCLYALAAGTAREALRQSRRWALVRRYVSGSIFVGLGLATALTGSHRSD